MDFPFVLPYNKRNYSPQGKRRTTMLYPIMNRSRSLIDLGGIWHFKLGDETEPEDTWSAPQEMELIAVPASYNDQKDDPSYRNHYGWAYYERTVELPALLCGNNGQRQVLRFDAVTHVAKVYINGKLIMTHKGGFLPFEVEITDLVRRMATLPSVSLWTTGSATALCPSATKVILPSSARTIPAFPVWKPQKYGERNRICRILISLILLASTDLCASTALRRPTLGILLWYRLWKVTQVS